MKQVEIENSGYILYENGDIYSKKTNKQLKKTPSGKGYNLNIDKTSKYYDVNKLIKYYFSDEIYINVDIPISVNKDNVILVTKDNYIQIEKIKMLVKNIQISYTKNKVVLDTPKHLYSIIKLRYEWATDELIATALYELYKSKKPKKIIGEYNKILVNFEY